MLDALTPGEKLGRWTSSYEPGGSIEGIVESAVTEVEDVIFADDL